MHTDNDTIMNRYKESQTINNYDFIDHDIIV